MSELCAIYYVPPADSFLWRRGCDWLGRDPQSGRHTWPPPWLPARRWRALVADAAYYGLHGTLKAPFRPADGLTAEDLAPHVAELAQRYVPFYLPPLDLGVSHGHVVLEPRQPSPELTRLALDCVHRLDHRRMPEPGDDRRRWDPSRRLTPRQREMLSEVGYPHTNEQFAFHITLTGALTVLQRRKVFPIIRRVFAPVLRRDDVPVNEIALFRKRDAQNHYEIYQRLPLGRASAPATQASRR